MDEPEFRGSSSNLQFTTTAVFGPEEGVLLPQVRRDDDSAAFQVADLVNEQIRALAVGIIGDHDAAAALLLQLFEDLERLGAGGGAHIENDVVLLHIEEHRRQHAHRLLAADMARQRESDHVFVEILEGLHLPELLAVEIDLMNSGEAALLATLLLPRTTRSGGHSQSAGPRIRPSHQSDTWS